MDIKQYLIEEDPDSASPKLLTVKQKPLSLKRNYHQYLVDGNVGHTDVMNYIMQVETGQPTNLTAHAVSIPGISVEAKKSLEWDPRFTPSFTPEEMLKEGVFEGKYINIIKGIPASWKKLPKVVGPDDEPDVSLNRYKVKSRQPLSAWKKNGWIMTDKGGWFHWYCLYYLGRRLGEEDDKQIKRWRSFVARHMGQIKSMCKLGDEKCNIRQRQGLLQWGWDSTTMFDEEQCEKNLKRMLRLTNTTSNSM